MAGLLEEWEDRVACLENELTKARNTLATIRADIEHCISMINSQDQDRLLVDAAGLRLSQYLGSEL